MKKYLLPAILGMAVSTAAMAVDLPFQVTNLSTSAVIVQLLNTNGAPLWTAPGRYVPANSSVVFASRTPQYYVEVCLTTSTTPTTATCTLTVAPYQICPGSLDPKKDPIVVAVLQGENDGYPILKCVSRF